MLANPAARPPENKFADMSLVIAALKMGNSRDAVAVGAKLLKNISVDPSKENEEQTKSTFKSINVFLSWAKKLKYAENKNAAFHQQANQIIQSVVDIINGSTVTGNNKTNSYTALNLVLEAVEVDKLKPKTLDKLMTLKLPNADDLKTQRGLSTAIKNLGKRIIPLDGRGSADFIKRFVLLGETNDPARSLAKTIKQQYPTTKEFLASPQKEVFKEIISGSEEEFEQFTERYFRDHPDRVNNEQQVLSDIRLGAFIDQENISQTKKDLFFNKLLSKYQKNRDIKLVLKKVFPKREESIKLTAQEQLQGSVSNILSLLHKIIQEAN